MKIVSTKTLAAVAVIIIGFAAVFVLSNHLERIKPVLPEDYADRDLTLQGAKLKGFSFGLEGLIADWYWMRSLQYIGEKVVKSRDDLDLENLNSLNPRLLYPYLDNASDLDPKFLAVYSYGAVVLPAIDPQQAIKITEKGIANNPDEWRLYQQLGYIYWRLGNYEKAAEIYSDGAKIKDAPPFLKLMAAKMKSDGGSRDMAREIYRQMLEETDDKQVKQNAELRLLEIDSLDERDQIRAALQKFKTTNARCANNWQEILPLLQNVKLPNGKDFSIDKQNNLVDPSGAPYILDKLICGVRLDKDKTKIPMK
jgi:tetratricopeptide (TPR) repeat protein